MRKPTFYEFFAGGGMARAGLGPAWRCLFANDFDARKARSYAANWGADDLRVGDIHALAADDLPAVADLAWASFPCQDLSLAGAKAGLDGARSGAFFGFRDLIASLREQGRAPALLVVENVVGALTSHNGRDFATLCRAFRDLGYVYGALVLDAADFTPQSRPRLFVVACRADLAAPADAAPPPGGGPQVARAHALLDADLQAGWRWWRLPPPAACNRRLIDVIEDEPTGVPWHTPAQTQRLLSLMAPVHRLKIENARERGERCVGAVYRRTRLDADGVKRQRAEVRFDGLAGCLRTPGGGSSRQVVMIVEGARIRSRLLSPRECARLMGLPEDYVLPPGFTDACHLLGDGVAPPVVRHLSERLLLPLLGRAPAAAAA